jgi:hypothetical protein
MKPCSRFLTLVVLLLAPYLVARGDDVARFPFVIPWDDAAPSITNVGALNQVAAGANGFIATRNGHFYDGAGRRIRFLGVNIAGSANFPDRGTAEKVAARLHKYGINLVRLHHMDAEFAHPNLLDRSVKDHQHLDKDSLDALDYFVYQLKQHGIYVDINLHVSREFSAEDGFPETADLAKLFDFDKSVDFFEPRMIQLDKNYARDLLTHVNAYTHQRYVDEPAVAMIEINNENSLLGEAWSGKLDRLPPHYRAELLSQWNGWLKRKYGDTAGLKRAWSADDKPLGPDLLQNADFTRGAEHWTLETNTAPAAAKMALPDDLKPPAGVEGRALQVQVTTLGTQNWHIQLHQTGLDLTEGEPYTLTFRARADHARPLGVYTSLDHADWHHLGLDAVVGLTPEWRETVLAFTANRPEKDHGRLTFVLGDALGDVDLAGIALRPGRETRFPAGLSLETGAVPLGRPDSNPAGWDWMAFLIDTEHAYVQTMRDYVRTTLGAHAGVLGSQVMWGGVGGALRESVSDIGDGHYYWQHPSFPGTPWDEKNWNQPNTPLTRDGVASLADLARYRLAGKPYTVSEYDEPAPNDYRAETLPIIAAFAAEQDWDGLMLFDYNGDRTTYASDRIKGWFDMDTDPAKIAFLPAAAMLFERLDMPLARAESRLHLAPGEVAGLLAKNGQGIAAEWNAAGVTADDALNQRLSVVFDTAASAGAHPAKPAPDADVLNPEMGAGPLRWEGVGTDGAVFLAYSPSSQVMVGYLGGHTTKLSGWEVQAPEGPRPFAALTLTAMDGKAMDESHSLLLTAVGRVENTGEEWNATRTSVENHWGTGPTLAEGVSATIMLRTVVTRASVYSLDSVGHRLEKLPSTLSDGVLTFAISPERKTLWYEIEAGLKR